MATNHSDALRNPQVDYEPSDLSPRGILWFLIGLFVAGVFIELVLWGMFHFLARSQAFFPAGKVSPLTLMQPRAVPENEANSVMQNTPVINLSVFPQPRLQTDDALDMQDYLNAEQKLLNPPQPFTDPSGAVHIPVSLAMKLIEERGLPTRPSAPPKELSSQTESGNPNFLYGTPGQLPPKGAGTQKQPKGKEEQVERPTQ